MTQPGNLQKGALEEPNAPEGMPESRTFDRWGDWLGVGTVVILVLLTFFEVAFMGKTFQTAAESVGVNGFDPPTGYISRVPLDYRLDPGASAWQMEPWAEVTNQALKAGQLPLWNPYQAAGAPLAANMQSAPFDPLLTWVNLHPTQLAWDLAFLMAFILGGIAAYAFGRIRGLQPLAAVVGAGAFVMTGFFMLYSNNHFFRTYLYLPVLGLLIEMVIRSSRVLFIVALGMAIAGTIYIGMPESSLFVLATAGGFAIYRSIRGPGEFSSIRRLLRLAGSATLGLALAAPLLLIFADYLRVSYNAHPVAARTGLVVEPKLWLINWVFPFINSASISSGGAHSVTRGWSGMAVMTTSVIALTARKQRKQFQGWFFGAAALVLFMKAYGFPGVQWLGTLPLAELANFHAFALPVAGFCAAMLAAIGVQAIADGAIVRFRAIPALVAFGLVMALLFKVNENLFTSSMSSGLLSHWALVSLLVAVALLLAFVFSRRIGIAVALSLLGAGGLLLFPSLLRVAASHNLIAAAKNGYGRDVLLLQLVLGAMASTAILIAAFALSRRAGAYLAAAAIVAELLLLAPRGIYQVRFDPYRQPPWFSTISRSLAKDSTARVFGLDAKLFPNVAGALGVQDIRAVDALYLLRYVTYIRSFVEPEFNNRFVGGPFGQNEEKTPANFEDNRMFDLLGVRYLITGSSTPKDAFMTQLFASTSATPALKPAVFDLRGDRRQVLLEQAPQEILYPITEGRPSKISFAYALDSQAWSDPAADGVLFSLDGLGKDGKRRYLWQATYIPGQSPVEPEWREAKVDLKALPPLAGLIFRTDQRGNSSSDIAGWANVTLNTADSPNDSENKGFSLVGGIGNTNVFENLSRVPRTFIVRNIHQVRDMTAAVSFFASSEQRFPDGAIHVVHFDPLREAVVESHKDFNPPLKTFQSNKPSMSTEKPPRIISYTPNRVVINTELNGPGLLVLTDMYASGWKVLVDGVPKHILPVDIAFRGVMLDGGSHRVVFQYQPRPFMLGLAIAALALFAASGALTVSWVLRRRATFSSTDSLQQSRVD